jgi:hypothetical protein
MEFMLEMHRDRAYRWKKEKIYLYKQISYWKE